MNNNSSSDKVNKIKPKVLFKLIEKKFPKSNNTISLNIPPSEIGGLTLLEHTLLVSIVKITDPKFVFEFGTYLGATSFVLAANSSKNTRIYTLDIPPNGIKVNANVNSQRGDIINDNFLRKQFTNYGAIYLKKADASIRGKVNQLFEDSTKMSVSNLGLENKFDIIFIDGGHDYETIKNDTEKSLKMLKKNGFIIWHDYNSNLHTNVSDYLNELCSKIKIYHVEPSMIAFSAFGDFQELFG